jgi:predicted ATPase
LHTGEAQRHERDYVGVEVHRAARIAAAAHGAQIVVSDATRRLVQDALAPDVSLCDLGSHRFKDFPTPERVYQVIAPGLQRDFPRLRSLGASSKLPVPPTALVGRASAVADLVTWISNGARLVTLTGPGGTGKTRLGLAVAAALDAEFPAGVYFVPLAHITEAADMWAGIAQAMALSPHGSARDAVVEDLRDARVLFVLDNLEQIPQAAEVVADLIGAAATVTALVTSRRPVHLQAEQVYPVPTLALPPSAADVSALADVPSVELFVQRARMVRPDFVLTPSNASDVARICLRLDGLPLAIEIAASQVRVFPPDALLRRLIRVLELSSGDADRPARQQTLRNTIAWSEGLLTPPQATALRRLGVFAGGCDLDAFAAVAAADVGNGDGSDPLDIIENLVDHGLAQLSFTTGEGTRVVLLETIREYARERLARSDDAADVRRRHAEYYLHLAEGAAEKLRGSDHIAMVDRLEAEHDNLRVALGWALAAGDEPDQPDRAAVALRLVSALGWFWYGHGHVPEGRHWLERAIEAASDQATPELGLALHGLGVLLLQQGEAEAAQAVLERSLALARDAGDPVRIAQDLSSLGVAHRDRGDADTARRLIEESIALARTTDDRPRLANALSNLAVLEMDVGAADRAVALLRETSAIDRQLDDEWGLAVDQTNLAHALLRAGQPHAARDALVPIATVALRLGDLDLVIWVIEGFAATLAALALPLPAATLAGATDELRSANGIPRSDPDAAQLERYFGPTRADVPREEWQRAFSAGRELSVEDAVAFAQREVGSRDALGSAGQ